MRFIRLSEVKTKTGLSRSTIYEYISLGMFPKNIKVGPRAVVWVDSEIESWSKQRFAVRQQTKQPESVLQTQQLLLQVFK
ncbi:helix-turn-helix transcriptional regulator [Vibrio sp. VB16]|uniref:helix-turn-helix transcriptional regulator n=1 Tax=Vibrio sp. VB16 TaxID=2785746 RepID=UPI00189D3154|nr:AlpA family transcriptional regulator [Vibrio sp. VB16]UGA53711.1 AlpA family transcriptional regulator [Vibrio sp. VB16]